VDAFRRLAAAAFFTLGVARAAPPAPAAAPVPGGRAPAAPDAALAGSLAAPAPGPGRQGPALEFDRFRYAVEGQVSGKRREEMADLEKLVTLGGAETELPGWLFRLAELHWEESQYLFFEANRRDDELARQGGGHGAARLRAEKADLEARSRAEGDRAIARYRDIVRRFPRWERLDEVVFFLGENLWKAGRRKDALVSYKALVTRYPRSRFVPDAWIAFGEHFFDAAEKVDREANLRRALEAYERAAAHEGSAVAGFALYKQGWVHYNLGDWERALALFAQVVAVSERSGPGAAPDRKLALAREARKDYVRAYVHVGSPREAPGRFAQVGGPAHARAMLKGLAGLYWESGKDREAILVYHRLIEAEPGAPEAPLFQARIVTAAGRIGRRDLAVRQARRFAEVLRQAEGSREAASDEGRRTLESARGDAENTLRTLAVQYHAEWRKTRDPQTAGLAVALYREYLGLFPRARHARELRFFHAELLFALERWQEAGDEYTRVVEEGAAAPAAEGGAPLRFQVEALESAVLAYAEVARRAGPPPPAAPGPPRMTTARRQLVAACERYLALAPRGAKAVEIAYQAAQEYYANDELPAAERLFAGIALDHPRHELARFSANLALDTLNLRRDWRGMNALARRFWEHAELMRAHPELRADLARVVEGSAFKLVEELQRGGRPAEAAEAYLAFATEWPQSKLAPTALHNAAIALAGARELERAIAVREQLAARHPAHPLAARALATNAADWAATAELERAAEAWERYHAGWKRAAAAARRPAPAAAASAPRARPRGGRAEPVLRGRAADEPGPEAAPAGPGYEERVARDGLFDAGVLREALGQLRKAEADRLLFLETWPGAREAPQVFLSLADLAAREGAAAREARLLREYQRRFARDADDWLAAQHRIARALERRGDAAGARRAWAEALAYSRGKRVGERGMPAVAQARLLALEADYRAYDRVAFSGGARQLKSRVEEKARKLEALQRAYTEVVNLKVPEPAVCALVQVGTGYRRFAAALLATPVPAEIRGRPDLAQEYRKQLAQFAEAPEKKGLEGLELALAKARELGVEGGCAKEAAAALARARPREHAAPVERLPAPEPGQPLPADLDAAWREGRAALLRDPADRAALAALVRVALARGKPGVARLLAQRGEKAAPGDPELRFLLGRAHAALGDRGAARADLASAAEAGHAGARRALLDAAVAARDWEGAAGHARELARREPDDARAALALGIAERHLGRLDEALAAYARAEQLAGARLPEVHLARAVLLAEVKGRCVDAAAELRRYESLAGPGELDAAVATAVERACAAQPVPAAAVDTRADARPAGGASAGSPAPTR
jgi:tetratricopeptide (TPR) repeat protein